MNKSIIFLLVVSVIKSSSNNPDFKKSYLDHSGDSNLESKLTKDHPNGDSNKTSDSGKLNEKYPNEESFSKRVPSNRKENSPAFKGSDKEKFTDFDTQFNDRWNKGYSNEKTSEGKITPNNNKSKAPKTNGHDKDNNEIKWKNSIFPDMNNSNFPKQNGNDLDKGSKYQKENNQKVWNSAKGEKKDSNSLGQDSTPASEHMQQKPANFKKTYFNNEETKNQYSPNKGLEEGQPKGKVFNEKKTSPQKSINSQKKWDNMQPEFKKLYTNGPNSAEKPEKAWNPKSAKGKNNNESKEHSQVLKATNPWENKSQSFKSGYSNEKSNGKSNQPSKSWKPEDENRIGKGEWNQKPKTKEYTDQPEFKKSYSNKLNGEITNSGNPSKPEQGKGKNTIESENSHKGIKPENSQELKSSNFKSPYSNEMFDDIENQPGKSWRPQNEKGKNVEALKHQSDTKNKPENLSDSKKPKFDKPYSNEMNKGGKNGGGSSKPNQLKDEKEAGKPPVNSKIEELQDKKAPNFQKSYSNDIKNSIENQKTKPEEGKGKETKEWDKNPKVDFKPKNPYLTKQEKEDKENQESNNRRPLKSVKNEHAQSHNEWNKNKESNEKVNDEMFKVPYKNEKGHSVNPTQSEGSNSRPNKDNFNKAY